MAFKSNPKNMQLSLKTNILKQLKMSTNERFHLQFNLACINNDLFQTIRNKYLTMIVYYISRGAYIFYRSNNFNDKTKPEVLNIHVLYKTTLR